MSGPIRFEVVQQSRYDRATRTIELTDGAPRYSYTTQGTYRTPGKEITYEVREVHLTWEQGKLNRVHITGLRLKKDGTVGLVKEHGYFAPTVKDPKRITGWISGGGPATLEWDWLNTLVAENSTPPPYDAA